MRHRKTVHKLGRTAAHRKSTLANLSASLFERKHITTTVAKAKATRQVSEKLITLAKKDTLHARRLAFKQLKQKRIIQILFDEIAPNYSDRPGGYTRVVKLGQRSGDGAHMAVLELIGFETASKKRKEKEAKKEAGKKKKGTKGDKGETAPPPEEKKRKAKKSKIKDKAEAEDKTKDKDKAETKKKNKEKSKVKTEPESKEKDETKVKKDKEKKKKKS